MIYITLNLVLGPSKLGLFKSRTLFYLFSSSQRLIKMTDPEKCNGKGLFKVNKESKSNMVG